MRVLRPLVRPAPTRLLLAAIVGALVAVAALAGSMASSAASGNNNRLPASLASSAPTSSSSQCANIERFHLEKQMNQRAAEILTACGRYSSRAPDTRANFSALARLSSSPNDYGGTDVNIITGGEGVSPRLTQSEVQVWSQGNDRRRHVQRLEDVAVLLLGRLLLDERRRELDEPEHEAVLHGPRHRLRRPGRLLRHRALEVGRDLPRLRLRRPGDRRLVLDRRDHLDGRPLRPLRLRRRPRVGLGRQQPGQPLLRRPVRELEQLRGRRQAPLRRQVDRRRPDLGRSRAAERRPSSATCRSRPAPTATSTSPR